MTNNGNMSERSQIRSVVIRENRGSPICLITGMFTDRIGQHEVLLPINHSRYSFRKNKSSIFR